MMTVTEALNKAIKSGAVASLYIVSQDYLSKQYIEPNTMFNLAEKGLKEADMYEVLQYQELKENGALVEVEVDICLTKTYHDEIVRALTQVLEFFYAQKDKTRIVWPQCFKVIPFIDIVFQTIAKNLKEKKKSKMYSKCLKAIHKAIIESRDYSSESEASTTSASSE